MVSKRTRLARLRPILRRGVSVAAAAALAMSCGGGAPDRSTTVQPAAREDAYRANNRGVALLEQFAYEPAVDAFREALAADPALRLARINLPIALFYAGRTAEAGADAQAARQAYPDAPQPWFVMGLAARLENDTAAAIESFRQVLQLDAADVGSMVNLALAYNAEQRYAEAADLARAALALEPFNATAAYNLGMALTRLGDADAAAQAMQRFETMRTAEYAVTYSQNYLEQGRYAEAVASTGIELEESGAPAAQFVDVTEVLLGAAAPAAPAGPPRGGITMADLDLDGDLDVVVAGPRLRVLRNDGSRLVDAAAAFGLGRALGPLDGAVAGDFDNDTRPDLLLIGSGGAQLFAQRTAGTFRAIAFKGAEPAARRATGAAAFVDVDHDGDLDVLLGGNRSRDPGSQPAPPSSGAGQAGQGPVSGGRQPGLVLLRNNGNGSFSDITASAGLAGVAAAVAIAPTDFDNRRDIDLLITASGDRPRLFRNLRTGAFEDVGETAGLPAAGSYIAMAIGDVNKDGFTDAFFGRAGAGGVLALSDGQGHFRLAEGPAASNEAAAAVFADYDNDGILDLVVLTDAGPRLFRSVALGWRDESERAFATELRDAVQFARGTSSLAAGDLDLDGDTDLVVQLPTGELRIWRNDGGSRNRSLHVTLAGRASNRGAAGAKIEMRAGSLQQKLETAAASPAVVPADLVFGLGQRLGADVVRVSWPSGIVQAETPAAGTPSQARLAITELDRKPSSCPFLFTWNGVRFDFVTDFLGGGELGSWLAPGQRNVPTPEEYVRISDRQLQPLDGRYELRVSNELEEVLFLDQAELLAVTHPAGVEVFPDEGLRQRRRPFQLFATRNHRPLRQAVDDHGHDVLAQLASADRRYVDDFALRPIRGYAAEHSLTLDLPPAVQGERAANAAGRTVLLLTGWTDYAFSSDNVAASQAGVPLTPPLLQVQDGSRWRTVDDDVGVPIGRPQTLVVDVSRYAGRRLRLVTAMRIYWDQILVADVANVPLTVTPMAARSARLRWRGFSAEAVMDGKEPYRYDYARVLPTAPWKMMPGRYTREGDVGELLTRSDDRFVVSRPGDVMELSFDAAAPPLDAGARRTFLLRGIGYSKEMNLHSASPDYATPFPFKAMSRYPYSAPERYPHPQDIDRFHTRVISRTVPGLAEADGGGRHGSAAGGDR